MCSLPNFVRAAVAFGLLLPVLTPCARAGAPVDAIVARVNGEAVLLSQLREAAADQGYAPEDLDRAGIWSEAWRRALTQYVDETLLVQLARNEEVKVDDTEIATQVDRMIQILREGLGSAEALGAWLDAHTMTMDQFRRVLTRREERRMLVSKIIARGVAVDAGRLETFRTERETAGLPLQEVDLAQILIRCPQAEQNTGPGKDLYLRALLAAREAGKNPQQFDAVAREYSDDVGSRARGGRLGWLDPSQLRPVLRDRVATMKPGDVSEPIASSEGYHVLLLAGRHTTRDLLFASEYERERVKLIERQRREASLQFYNFKGEPIDLNETPPLAEPAVTEPAEPAAALPPPPEKPVDLQPAMPPQP